MVHSEGHFLGGDRICLYQQEWLPDGSPKAVVVLVHGFTEHSGRYARLAGDLTARGWAVWSFDLRGHGRSAGQRCFIASFREYLDDLDAALAAVRARHGDLPRFLFGHSLGGAIAGLHATERQPAIKGLILSGPALEVGRRVFPLLRRAAWMASRLFPRMRVVRMGSGRISRDPAVVAAFRRDPLVFHDRFPIRTGAEILAAAEQLGRQADQLLLPLLMLHGTSDAVCDADGTSKFFQRAGSPDKTLRLYEGLYHEILSEPERADVLADLTAWIDARL